MRGVHRLVAGIATALLASACGDAPGARLRVGINPWPGYQSLALGIDRGYFRDVGLDLQVVEYSSLHDLRRAFDLGQIDVMPCTLVEVLEVHNEGARVPEVIFVPDASCGADVVLATAACQGLGGLRGRKVAYEPDSLGVYILGRLVERAGLRIEDVQAVGMDQTEMVVAMREGRIDAAITYPPASLQVAEISGVHRIFSTADIPGEVLDVIAVDRQMLDRDPEFLPRFYAAMGQTCRFVAAHPDEAQAAMAKSMHILPQEWPSAVQGVELFGVADQREWIWQPTKVAAIARRLDGVLQSLRGGRRPLPEAITAAARPMPPLEAAAAPR
jgi:NitT/TauT family transport system substrate-binding protein